MNLDILPSLDARATKAPVESTNGADEAESGAAREEWIWNLDTFGREQLRGLVQRIFFSGGPRPVRQVVISPAESRTEVSGICRQVGEILSRETSANVVIAAGDLSCLSATDAPLPDVPKRDPMATRVSSNL